ncbi:MAG TPA: head GIN domain-containing protein [Flavisolibacter sp.]|nr:head GIN domain-containing protein [Flavisolibacter sp.]
MRQTILLASLVAIFSSCNFMGGKKVRGNGNIISQTREVSNFTGIDVSGAVTVRLKQEAPAGIRVETDENLMEYLEVKVDGNTVVIQPRKGYNLNPSKELIVYVSASRFTTIDVSGASQIISEAPITSDELDVHATGASEIIMQVKLSKFTSELSGASTLKLSGDVTRFATEASGASKILCLDLKTAEAELNVSGATEAEISAEKELTIDASGASNVKYRGNANINQKSTGASNVKKV